jgi:succinoglycan biosynthesis protein ExoM
VVQTLVSLAAQALAPGVTIRAIVCDNDVERSARDLVEATAAQLGLPALYVHAPAKNISIARNACLDAATAPLVAFIDDDEVADPRWLQALLDAQAQSGADVVFGLVRAVYGAGLPAWTAQADLHSTPSPVRRDGAIASGYTCNVLMRREAVGGQRFDLALGRSGGEDTVFFHRLGRAGARFAFAEDALVLDPVPQARARTSWLLKRSFRAGQTHALLLLDSGANRAANLLIAAGKLAYCGLDTMLHAFSPAAWRRRIVRAALHAGVVSRLAGLGAIELY